MSRTKPELVTKVGLGNFARIKSLAQANDLQTDIVAQRFCLEAAIRRIFTSDHAHRFGVASLKGGTLMFLTEGVDPIGGRATSDIDVQLSGFQGTMDELAAIMKDVLAAVPSIDDGVRFDVEGLKVLGTRDGGVPGGAVTCVVQLGNAVVKFKADVGFYSMDHADTLEECDYPSLLPGQLNPVRIWRQPIEFAMADKCHAAVQHGRENTRFRDYYDLFLACTRHHVNGDKLQAAFLRSWPLYADTATPPTVDKIVAYADDFARRNQGTWATMQAGWRMPTPDLQTVCETIRNTLGPVLDDINNPSMRAAA